jgi:hypothetical protein
MRFLFNYLSALTTQKTVLWCYLIWYIATVSFYFDSSLKLWLNSLGISALIGTGLLLSVTTTGKTDYWQRFRLYLMPFCVSSFSSLIKDKGFILFISPNLNEALITSMACFSFILLVYLSKHYSQHRG